MKAVLLDEKRLSEGVDLPAPESLSEYVTFEKTPHDNALIIERCQDADIVIAGSVRFEKEVIDALPNLKLLQLSTVGSNQVDKQACEANNVTLLTAPDFATESVAEHTFMLMLNAMRAGLYYHNHVADGTWHHSRKNALVDESIVDLHQLTLGLIGVGDIGRRISHLAQAFGMTVLWAERQGKTPRNEDYTAFETVLAQSDVLSLQCPWTEETEHLINADTLAKMSNKPLIVNVARGKVVDSQAVADALKADKIMGYATDVYEQEPADTTDPIVQLANKKHPRVILSPHHAAASKAAQRKLWGIVRRQVSEFAEQYSAKV